jgi:dCTP deaminase
MLLSGSTIKSELEVGNIYIEPFDPSNLRLASYVLSLGPRFRRWRASNESVPLWSAAAGSDHLEPPIESQELVIGPGEFVLGCTAEAISVSIKQYAIISPLSHIARFGLGINCGADFVNPGFGTRIPSRLTLELFNHNSSALTLTAGMPIAHLRFGMVIGASEQLPLGASVYEGNDPVTIPRFFEEWSTVRKESP